MKGLEVLPLTLIAESDPTEMSPPTHGSFDHSTLLPQTAAVRLVLANRLRFDPRRVLPNYVGVNPVVRYDNFTIAGPAYLGESFGPFAVTGDPNAPEFRVPNIGLADPGEARQVTGRAALCRNLDALRRRLDRTRAVKSMDRFHQQALNLLTSREAARAFDLSLESPRVRDRYGRNAWGQQ